MADRRPEQTFPEASMRDFYNVLFRHKTKILIFFFSVVIVVTLGTLLASEVYLSEAKLMVRIGRESVALDPTASTGQVVNIGSERESEINSETEILKSQELAEKVVDAIGVKNILEGPEDTLAPGDSLFKIVRYGLKQILKVPAAAIAKLITPAGPPSQAAQMKERDRAVQSLIKHLNIDTTKKSSIISISYETSDPRLARDVVDKLIAFYLDKHINAHRTTGSYQFFNQQKEALQASLARTENELRNLKNSTGMASIQEQKHILLERLGGIQKELEETESAAAASTARVQALRASIASLPGILQKDETTGFANSAADGMRKQIYELELKEQELLSTFTADSIPVQEIHRQIREGQALLSKAEQTKQVTRGINENYQKVQLDLLTEQGNLSALQAKAGVLKAQLDGGRRELSTLNDTETRLAQLERDLDTQKTNYRKYSESLEQARIDQALEMEKISNISIVQPASFPVKPIRPKKLLNLALGILLGASGGLGLALFSEYQDHSFKKPEDVDKRLNLPVLATLPDHPFKNAANGLKPAGRNGIPRGSHPLVPLGANGNGNAVRELSHVLTIANLAAHCAIGIVGSRPGEGVSTVVEVLARQLARQGGRVLVVDANSHCPSQHRCFGANLSPGLTDFSLNGKPTLSYVQPTEVENLDLLSAGDERREAHGKAAKRLAEDLPALKREYSHIIFDLPSPQDHGPTRHISGLLDGIILLVEAENTRWEVADRTRENLLLADSNVLGVILNRRRFHIPDWLYRTL
jgi:uncharacterized protein involved in exopolysaccharide biosynthesis/Mrp family chromosome partitioning ATPase